MKLGRIGEARIDTELWLENL